MENKQFVILAGKLFQVFKTVDEEGVVKDNMLKLVITKEAFKECYEKWIKGEEEHE